MIKAALNGGRTRDEHPAVPITAAELAAEAVACAATGAGAIHLHARDPSGAETIDPVVVNEVARLVRDACGLPVGISSSPTIEPDAVRRLELLREWREPDFGSAMFNDPGATSVAAALLSRGIDVEAAVVTAGDVDRLAACGLADRMLRVIVEPMTEDVGAALAECAAIHAALDAAGIAVPRLQHGMGAACWPLAVDALARGWDTRIGFEDVLVLPDGGAVTGNADLVAAATAGVAS